MVELMMMKVVVITLLPFLLEPHSAVFPGSHPFIHPSTHSTNIKDLYYVLGIVLGFYTTVYAFISTDT